MQKKITKQDLQTLVQNDFGAQELKAAMEKEPLLTNWGIGPYALNLPKEKDKRGQILKNDRALLADNVYEFRLACLWLKAQKKNKLINKRMTSYGLKEYVEKWARNNGFERHYVSNGAFIAAAIHLGFKYEIFHMSKNPNVCINISSKLFSPELS